MVDSQELRNNRTTRGSELRALRIDRENRTRGSIVNYYEDLGLSTSEENYNNWKEYDTLYNQNLATQQEAISERQAQIDAAQSAYDKAASSLGSVSKAVQDSWNSHKASDLVKVTLGTENTKETLDYTDYLDYAQKHPGISKAELDKWWASQGKTGWTLTNKSYYIPKGSAQNLIASLQKAKVGFNYPSANTLYVDRTASTYKLFGGSGNKDVTTDLISALKEAQDTYYTAYVKKATETFAKQYGESSTALSKEKSNLDAAIADLTTAKNQVSFLNEDRNKKLEALRNTYQSKIQTLAELFGGK